MVYHLPEHIETVSKMLNKITDYKVVLGVIGADCHAVGNKFLSLTLEQNGVRVAKLGVMSGQQEFISAALETGADAILVSSIYGHGEIDCQNFRDRCLEQGIGDIILYAGGNLVIGKRDFNEVEKTFRDMGFDRVFPPTANLKQVIELLKSDIDERRHVGYGNNSAAFGVSLDVLPML